MSSEGAAVLYVSLALSAALVGLSVASARPAPEPVRWDRYLVGGGATAFCLCWIVGFPAVMVTYPTLAAVLGVWSLTRHRCTRRLFAAVAVAVAVAIQAGALGLAAAEFARLRADYPLEPMAERVPSPAPAPHSRTRGTDEVDIGIEYETRQDRRTRALKRLHGDAADLFIQSAGFGVGRMHPALARPSDGLLRVPPRPPAPPQAGSDAPPASGPGVSSLNDLHAAGVIDFLNPKGFGYSRDRHAAGFQPHGFTEVPGPTPRYQVERVELVSLLLHAEPAVYVSDTLPEMTTARTMPTRPLDSFESAALAELHAGRDLVERDDRTPARLMGSLRNGNQCVACHGGERGDLLGAFSYTLRVR